jgi:predicted transposase YbfD/YdcC
MHYIKDTRFGEDKSKLRKGDTPSNMSVVRNIAINLFRHLGNKSVAGSIRQLAHDIKGLAQIILE